MSNFFGPVQHSSNVLESGVALPWLITSPIAAQEAIVATESRQVRIDSSLFRVDFFFDFGDYYSDYNYSLEILFICNGVVVKVLELEGGYIGPPYGHVELGNFGPIQDGNFGWQVTITPHQGFQGEAYFFCTSIQFNYLGDVEPDSCECCCSCC